MIQRSIKPGCLGAVRDDVAGACNFDPNRQEEVKKQMAIMNRSFVQRR